MDGQGFCDRRNFSRVRFNLDAMIKNGGREFKAQVENISLKGMLVSTNEKIDMNTPVEITLYLTGTSSELSLNLEGMVVRVKENGVALKFSNMSVDSFIHLKNIVAYNSGDEDSVMEEFLNNSRETSQS